ncbi:hypothetical protein BLA23254_00109 [Burkholderia lata]|uniref:Uncharacterized protein n=1 Tax=Burkholderia lata (strain ATCC 17760 / DSM 23089 / LMG 22485 / NCIMB 9086 / R18194 / 383) TaxID=482957 RepID=A0A6P2GQE5_BURL3|nr:hypothetical protein [Burkholderia lata]VWB06343.1 hypothetical protein BLA23254_00109 [Burkholderia lata]
MIRNTRDVSGWRQEDSRRLNGASTRVDTGGSRMTQHSDSRFA